MKVLVTGANGFVGKNFRVALTERCGFELQPVYRDTDTQSLSKALQSADAVVHLAGVNRPQHVKEFDDGNAGYTTQLCGLLADLGRPIPLALSSSTQAALNNPYGKSKLQAEKAVAHYAELTGAPVTVYRFPNIFGKWCRPNYNSAVATFCYNISRGLDIQIHDPSSELKLVYVDDVVAELFRFLEAPSGGYTNGEVSPVFSVTVGELVEQIRTFANVRDDLIIEPVGTGFMRALYATYISYLDPIEFSYDVPMYSDERGVFVEMLKTKDSGQFSFFSARPGVTRGGHYHHSKTEKFVVIKGNARFNFRHILTDEKYTLETSGEKAVVVESIPGWAHDVTNVGSNELLVMLWANEIFDRDRPDTFSSQV